MINLEFLAAGKFSALNPKMWMRNGYPFIAKSRYFEFWATFILKISKVRKVAKSLLMIDFAYKMQNTDNMMYIENFRALLKSLMEVFKIKILKIFRTIFDCFNE